MDELEFPDFGGEVTPVARPDWRYYGECWEACDGAQFVLGTELGLAMEDCEGVQVEITL